MATIEIDVCAGLEASGHTVHYVNPEAMPLQVKDVRRIGPYIGAYHTRSLQQAQSTIFLDNDGTSPLNVIAVHVTQSPMIVRQRMMSARAVSPKPAAQPVMAPAVMATVAIAKAKAAAAMPAPVLKPRVPTTTGQGSGGF